MKNKKYNKYKWIFIILNVILVALIVNTSVNIFHEEGNTFCVWGLSCNDGQVVQIIIENWSSNYEAWAEGIVKGEEPYEESFFKSLGKVLEVSREEYNETIQEILNEGTFEEIYKNYSKIFQDNYSLEIDNQFVNDYIQNFGELISNKYHGDCDDYATWIYIIAKEKGLEVRYVIGFNEKDGHAWIQIKIDGEWIDYNSTGFRKGKNKVSKEYLTISYYEGDKDE